MNKKIEIGNYAYDEPKKTDYTYSSLIELQGEVASGVAGKRDKSVITVQDQKQTPGCTVFSAGHVINGLNNIEDKIYGKFRKQIDSAKLWEKYCIYRGYFNGGSAIQTIGDWAKKEKLISGYVTIPKQIEKNTMLKQMKQVIDMGSFMSCGSGFGNWSKIGKTGIYEESNPLYFLGHAFAIIGYEEDYFWAINSYGPKRGPFGGYFKIPFNLIDKLYSKLVFIDYDDKVIFDKLQEVEKLKQGIGLIREVYKIADRPVQQYIESIKLGENFSKLYNTTI